MDDLTRLTSAQSAATTQSEADFSRGARAKFLDWGDGYGGILLEKSLAVLGGSGLVRSLTRLSPSGGPLERDDWHQLCHFTQILGGCCEQEFVCTIWTSYRIFVLDNICRWE